MGSVPIDGSFPSTPQMSNFLKRRKRPALWPSELRCHLPPTPALDASLSVQLLTHALGKQEDSPSGTWMANVSVSAQEAQLRGVCAHSFAACSGMCSIGTGSVAPKREYGGPVSGRQFSVKRQLHEQSSTHSGDRAVQSAARPPSPWLLGVTLSPSRLHPNTVCA